MIQIRYQVLNFPVNVQEDIFKAFMKNSFSQFSVKFWKVKDNK